MKPKKEKRQTEEGRARQLAGLMYSGDESVQSKGSGATVPEEVQKQIVEMHIQGATYKAIQEATGINTDTASRIILNRIEHDTLLRSAVHKNEMRTKLQSLAKSTADKLIELVDEMTPKEAAYALSVVSERLERMDAEKGIENLHQHVHIHSTTDINSFFEKALSPEA